MKMKKALALFLTCVLCLSALGGCGGSGAPASSTGGAAASTPAAEGASEGAAPAGTDASKLKIGIVTTNKISTQPFLLGIKAGFEKAQAEYGFEGKIIESNDVNEVEENVRSLVDDGFDLVIGGEYGAVDAINKLALEYPERTFAMFDATSEVENVRNIDFHEQEAAYLIGMLAGMVSETGKLGAVHVGQNQKSYNWRWGFAEGAEYGASKVGKTIDKSTIQWAFVGSYNDPAKAKDFALNMFNSGCDFINGACALGETGIIEASTEKGFYTSTQDVDKTEQGENIITGQIKNTDEVFYQLVADYCQGNWSNETIYYGLKEKGVGMLYVTKEGAAPRRADVFTDEMVNILKQTAQEIIDGKIDMTVPLEK
ncbi:BMP family protein [Oscillospiraceae bacterium MB08-C2-2]|nr:BMP family protein [Oscillospiraceae bacterium MB08-C2-2]